MRLIVFAADVISLSISLLSVVEAPGVWVAPELGTSDSSTKRESRKSSLVAELFSQIDLVMETNLSRDSRSIAALSRDALQTESVIADGREK